MGKNSYVHYDLLKLMDISNNLIISNGLLSGDDITSFNISNNGVLKRIVIGDDCFGKARTFALDGMNMLESIKIGQKSFKIDYKERSDGDSRIVNCPKLASIQIGRESFQDYHSFELSNLPSLQSIDIGTECYNHPPLFSLIGLINGLI